MRRAGAASMRDFVIALVLVVVVALAIVLIVGLLLS
jgi:uncharacterized membrane protein YdfJ with MMPL/SSD domain